MNRRQRRALWLAQHRQQPSPVAPESNAQHAGLQTRALNNEPPAHTTAARLANTTPAFANTTAAAINTTAASVNTMAAPVNKTLASVNTTPASATASVNLHIQEMVLHGFAPHDRYTIGDALQHELTRLLTTHGAPSSLHAGDERARVNAGSFNVKPLAGAKAVGYGVAHAVYGELKR